MSLVRVTPPELVVSVAEAKANLRVDHDEDDALIEGLIRAAMAFAQRYLSYPVGAQTFDLVLDAFPSSEIGIPYPLASVDSVSYVDADGVTQIVTADNYVADPSGWIVPAVDWPSSMSVINAVTVRFTTSEAVPDDVRQAILLLVGHYYEHREAAGDDVKAIPLGVEMLLGLNRRMFV